MRVFYYVEVGEKMPEEKYVQLAMMTKESFIEYMNQIKIHQQTHQKNKSKRTIRQFYHDLKAGNETSFFQNSILIEMILFIVSVLMSVLFSRTIDGESSRIFQIMGIIMLIFFICTIVQNRLVTKRLNKQKQDQFNTIQILDNGQWHEMKENKLKVGDIFRLKAGDAVPVDARIILANNLYVSQKTITGNPNPVFKSSMINNKCSANDRVTDYQTLLFSGSRIITGEVEAMVIATKNHTFLNSLFQSMESPRYQTKIEKGLEQYFFDSVIIVAILILIFGIRDGDWLVAVIKGVTILMVSLPIFALFFYRQFLYFRSKNWSNQGVQLNQAKNIEIMGEINTLVIDDFDSNELNDVALIDCYDLDGEVSKQIYHYAVVQSSLYTGAKTAYDQAILNKNKENTLSTDYHLLNEKPSMIQPQSYRSVKFEDEYFRQYSIHIGSFEAIEQSFSQDKQSKYSSQLSLMREQLNTLEEESNHILTIAVQKENSFEFFSDDSFLLLGYLLFEVGGKTEIETYSKITSLIDDDTIICSNLSSLDINQKIQKIKNVERPSIYFNLSDPFIALRQEVDLLVGSSKSWFNQYVQYDVSFTNPSLKLMSEIIKLSKISWANAKAYLSKVIGYQLGMLMTLLLINIILPDLSLTLPQLFFLNIIVSVIFSPLLFRNHSSIFKVEEDAIEQNQLFRSVCVNLLGNIFLLLMIFIVRSFNEMPLTLSIESHIEIYLQTIHTIWFLFIVGTQWGIAAIFILDKFNRKDLDRKIVVYGTILVGLCFISTMHPIVRDLFSFNRLTILEWLLVLVSIIIYNKLNNHSNNHSNKLHK